MTSNGKVQFARVDLPRRVVLLLGCDSVATARLKSAAKPLVASCLSVDELTDVCHQLSGADSACVVADSAWLAAHCSATDHILDAGPGVVLLVVGSNEAAGRPSMASDKLADWRLVSLAGSDEHLERTLSDSLGKADSLARDRRLVTEFYDRVDQLSTEEARIMDAVCQGKLNKQIAREFNVSIRTVEQRRRRMFVKMEVGSAVPLATKLATVQTIQRLCPHLAPPPRNPPSVPQPPISHGELA